MRVIFFHHQIGDFSFQFWRKFLTKHFLIPSLYCPNLSGQNNWPASQQLAIRYGVAFSAIALQFFNTETAGSKVDYFHYTFITMGMITILSGWFFLFLKPQDGENLIKRSVVKKLP
ncbi:hypothetical protein CJJ18_02165 [Candidatus Williamhamiltonella defendens]|uniref:Uncharacterized protein n=1 Tax=Candidatus Williamhamiltonella defendens TaxID=138072 RepID=A0AAC9VJA2_9ENTR|nr:hypothetical protein CJJ18_02165 [Candidatus Hamiltonella defensa]AWK16051.1 hypothetical protein CCS40_02180 [Candidatus Hamiltonella defensa]